MEISLDRLCVGVTAVVTKINTEASLGVRLRCFGMIPGTRVRCRYRSPGGSVTALECRGSIIALRTRDMENIWGYC